MVVTGGVLIRRRTGRYLTRLMVGDVSSRRGPAPEAQQLYEETAESQAARERAREVQRLSAVTFDEGKPDKRGRRDLRKFRGR